jgi:hypothetical protein
MSAGRTALAALAFLSFAIPASLGTATAQDAISPVEIVFHTCPAGTDPASDPELLAGLCLEPSAPILVTVGDSESWLEQAETSGETTQAVTFDAIPSGWIQIVWEMPEDMEVAVAICDEHGEGHFEEALVWQFLGNVEGDRMFLRSTEPGDPLTCTVFHVPVGTAATPVASPVSGRDADFGY